jgi:hypothetical protein
MKKVVFALIALFLAPVAALALPGSSVYPNPSAKVGTPYGPQPCEACHKNNADFEKNVYVDIRDDKGGSLMKDGVAEIPFKPGESTVVQIVVGLNEQDAKAKVAGWFVNLPMGSSLARGSVNYCYQRINYELPSLNSADGKPFRTQDRHSITFHRYFAPTESEMWVGVGGKATDTEAGSDARKGTLGLKTIKIKWVKDVM